MWPAKEGHNTNFECTSARCVKARNSRSVMIRCNGIVLSVAKTNKTQHARKPTPLWRRLRGEIIMPIDKYECNTFYWLLVLQT